MENEKLLEYLHERAKYAEEQSEENEKNELLRLAEWYDGYKQACLTIINLLENKLL